MGWLITIFTWPGFSITCGKVPNWNYRHTITLINIHYYNIGQRDASGPLVDMQKQTNQMDLSLSNIYKEGSVLPLSAASKTQMVQWA